MGVRDKHPPAALTSFGFTWGEAEISRLCEHQGHIVLGLKTPKQEVTIRVTPTGLIRVGPIEKARGKRR